MKKYIIILVVALLGSVTAYSQATNRTMTTDTVQGAETIYFTPDVPVTYSDGVAGFTFEVDTIIDQAATTILQGSYDGSTWVDITSTANLAQGTYKYSDDTPDYLKYRMAITGASGDTIIYKNMNFFVKLPNTK